MTVITVESAFLWQEALMQRGKFILSLTQQDPGQQKEDPELSSG